MKKYILAIVVLMSVVSCYDSSDKIINPAVQQQDVIIDGVVLPGETGAQLATDLSKYFVAKDNIQYDAARDILYTKVEPDLNNEVEAIYSGYKVTIDPAKDGTTQMDALGINCEHTVPQSLFNKIEPMVSDMHHLFPSRVTVNGDRGNFPFADFTDVQTKYWYKDAQEKITTDPDGTASESPLYSKLSKNSTWEPRDAKKGDIARACMYFYIVYRSNANATSAMTFIQGMLPTLKLWDKADPADAAEKERNERIYTLQGNYNPFVIDATLADRVSFN